MTKIALSLAGGFAHGSFEVGAVRYLYDQGIRPNILCGTSVGALNALKLAEGEARSIPRASGVGNPLARPHEERGRLCERYFPELP